MRQQKDKIVVLDVGLSGLYSTFLLQELGKERLHKLSFQEKIAKQHIEHVREMR